MGDRVVGRNSLNSAKHLQPCLGGRLLLQSISQETRVLARSMGHDPARRKPWQSLSHGSKCSGWNSPSMGPTHES